MYMRITIDITGCLVNKRFVVELFPLYYLLCPDKKKITYSSVMFR